MTRIDMRPFFGRTPRRFNIDNAREIKRELRADEFTCDSCGGVFKKGMSDEEAMKEALEQFGDALGDDPAMVCDDCYIEMNSSRSRRLTRETAFEQQAKLLELDMLVAVKIMKWQIVTRRPGSAPEIDPPQGIYYFLGGGKCDDPRSWSPSDDMNHALEVLAKLDELGFEWELMNDWDLDKTTKGFSCKLEKNGSWISTFAETAPRAVCFAAIQALVG